MTMGFVFYTITEDEENRNPILMGLDPNFWMQMYESDIVYWKKKSLPKWISDFNKW